MDKPWSEVELIREAFHYQSRFDGSTMVFKIDYPVTEHPLFPSLVKDLALLSQTGFRVVIVPGAKDLIEAILNKNNISSCYKDSVRITSEEALPFVEMAAFHSATRFMTGFSGSRVDAIVGNFVRARGLGVVDGVDMKHTGKVDKFYIDSLRRVLDFGMIPILPCMGWSPAGKPYNVPSDEIAFEAAVNLKAIKLFIISLNAQTGENRKSIRLTPQEAALVLESNLAGGGAESVRAECFAPKALSELALAIKASKAGVERVHIIDGNEEGAVLKELFSNLGAGIMVYADEYESIRGIRSRDIPDILRIMEPLMQAGFLLRRKSEDIQNCKDDYAVFEIDGSIHACGALHDWGEGQGEIAAIATDPAYSDMGLGSRIVRYLIDKAKKQGFKRVFVLTIRTHDWFESLGFSETSLDTLPEKKRRLYDHSRNSKVFALGL